VSTFDDILDLVYFVSTKKRESVFNSDDFFCMGNRLGSLSISLKDRFDYRSQLEVFEVLGKLVDFLWRFCRNGRGNLFNDG